LPRYSLVNWRRLWEFATVGFRYLGGIINDAQIASEKKIFDFVISYFIGRPADLDGSLAGRFASLLTWYAAAKFFRSWPICAHRAIKYEVKKQTPMLSLITSWKISQGYATRSRVIFSFLSLIISLIKYYFNEAGSNLLRVFLHLCITWKI
jgi:hypothetical protein